MEHLFFRYISLFIWTTFTLSCNVVPVATVQLELYPTGDTQGNSSSIARLRFSDYSATLTNDESVLQIVFTNVEGDRVQLNIDDSSSFATGSYNIDGSNSVQIRATLTRNLTPETVELEATSGFINIAQLVTDSSGVLQQVAGSFSVTFDQQGAAQGEFNSAGGN